MLPNDGDGQPRARGRKQEIQSSRRVCSETVRGEVLQRLGGCSFALGLCYGDIRVAFI